MINVCGLLQSLVAIPSVNPRFDKAEIKTTGEGKLSEWLEHYLSQHKFNVKKDEVLPGRFNVTAIFQGSTSDAICLNAHLDTVPVEGMSVDPFAGEIKDEKMFGRGTADTKGSMAAMIAAAIDEIEENPQCPSIILLFTCDEETGFAGAKFFKENNQNKIKGIVIGEPTNLELITTHKGVLRTIIKTSGIASHSSMPEKGKNAVYSMAKAISLIEELNEELAQKPKHKLLGNSTISVGTISGGTAVNSVPDKCEINIDRRILPDESIDDVMVELSEKLHEISDIEIEKPYLAVPGFQISENHPWFKFISKATGIDNFNSVQFATDGAVMHCEDTPCIVIGPGKPSAAHTKDESIEITELEKSVKLYRKIIKAHQAK